MPDLAGAILTPLRALRRATLAPLRTIDLHTRTDTYGPDPRHRLSLWTPPTLPPQDGWPTVLLLHGGGWIEGSRHDFDTFAPLIARKGIQCAAIDYRLAPQDPWPAQLDDALRAIRHLSHTHNANPRRILLWGHSAGGHIALMAATRHDVAGTVALGAPSELDTLPRPPDAVFPNTRLRDASPRHVLPETGAPILLVHGSRDRVCPPTHARALRDALPERCTLIEVRGGNHGLHWPPVACLDAKRAAIHWACTQLKPPHN